MLTQTEKIISEKIKRNNNGDDKKVLIRVNLIDICKDFNAGIMLAQIIYWAGRTGKNNGWFYKSGTDWYDEVRLSESKVKTGTKILKKLGFIDTENHRANGHNTRWYKLKLDNVLSALDILYAENNESLAMDAVSWVENS